MKNSLETIKKATGKTTQHDMARILGYDSTNMTALVKNPTPGFRWRAHVAAFLTSKEMPKDIRNWRIETDPGSQFFHVVFGTGTTLTFLGGQVVGWRVDLPGTDLQVRYKEGRLARLAARDGGEPPDGWKLRNEEDGSVTVIQVPAGGGTGPRWRLSAGRTLESFTLPAGPAVPSAFARLTRAGALDHPALLASPGARLGVGPARPSPRPSDTGSGSRTPGPSRKRARPSVPAGVARRHPPGPFPLPRRTYPAGTGASSSPMSSLPS